MPKSVKPLLLAEDEEGAEEGGGGEDESLEDAKEGEGKEYDDEGEFEES